MKPDHDKTTMNVVEVGQKYRLFWNKNNINNATIHVRAIVDEYTVVYKKWLRHKNRWCYVVDDISYLSILKEQGVLKQVR